MQRFRLVLVGLLACGGSSQNVETVPAPTPDQRPALLTPGARSPRIANYEIDATLDAGDKRITGSQTLTWRNTGTRAVSTLPFHLYMNAFKNQESLFMTSSGGAHRGQEAADDGWGWIEVVSISVDGGADVRATARHTGPDETVLEVPLVTPVQPGASVRVTMQFEVQLPVVFARTGYRGDFIMAGQWFPKIGVRVGAGGNERWHCEPFHAHSEFFADFGVYDVRLTVPDTHVVAATGVLTAVEAAADGSRTLSYHAEDVHDFAWMADPFMKMLRGTASNELGEVEVRVYYRPGQEEFARRHLTAGVGSIEQFSQLYVPYPWAIMSIIDPPPEASGSAGGMEYPTLVTTAADHALSNASGVRIPELVTVHEVGHNWFQGILASNETEEAWLDEGVNEYADSLVMDAVYGERDNLLDHFGFSADSMEIRAIENFADLPVPIATRPADFPDFGSYAGATYGKTGVALRTLENAVGRDRFRAAMKEYTRRFAFRHPTGEDLWRTLEQALGEDLDWFVQPAFYGRGVVDLQVRDLACRERSPAAGVFGAGEQRQTVSVDDAKGDGHWLCDVLLVNLGDVPVPVDIELVFADGARSRERWDPRTGDPRSAMWHRLRTDHTSEVVEVLIDPEHKVLLDVSLYHSGWREGAESGPARAAGARAQFWTQTMMQLGGL